MKEFVWNILKKFVAIVILKEKVWVKSEEFFGVVVEQVEIHSNRHRWRINEHDVWKNGKHPMRQSKAAMTHLKM